MANQVHISVDLKKLATYELKFLKMIDDNNFLNAENITRRAIWRYEVYWLPLAASLKSSDIDLVPPIDVHWIWHCHMLSPKHYQNDCFLIIGTHIKHHVIDPTSKDYKLKQKVTKQLWYDKYGSSEAYFPTFEAALPTSANSYTQRSTYDLYQATQRQKGFFYNVSLPHYRDSKFLTTALIRYKKFLLLMKNNPTEFIVPCYDIDLMWHTHQLENVAYRNDCMKLVGRLINHDDTDTDRGENSNLKISFKKTCELWKTAYKEKYEIYGTLSRGSVSNKQLFNSKYCKLGSGTETNVKVVLRDIVLKQINADASTQLVIKVYACNSKISSGIVRMQKIKTVRMHANEIVSFIIDAKYQYVIIIKGEKKAKLSIGRRKISNFKCTFDISKLISNTDRKQNEVHLESELEPTSDQKEFTAKPTLSFTCYLYPLPNATITMFAATLEPFTNHNEHLENYSENLWGPLPFVNYMKEVNYTYSIGSQRLVQNQWLQYIW